MGDPLYRLRRIGTSCRRGWHSLRHSVSLHQSARTFAYDVSGGGADGDRWGRRHRHGPDGRRRGRRFAEECREHLHRSMADAAGRDISVHNRRRPRGAVARHATVNADFDPQAISLTRRECRPRRLRVSDEGSASVTAIEVVDVCKSFGGVEVIHKISFAVEPGERRLLLGPNGAGKTTLFNMIAGDLRPSRGRILINGRDVSALPSHRRAALGIARTFQILTLFEGETVIGNVIMALLGGSPRRWNPLRAIASDREIRERAMGVLARVKLQALADRPVPETSYGEKRRLEIAMALAQDPQILLLDEPLAGLSREERASVRALLDELPGDLTIVMIEHDMDVALAFAEKISLLHYGELIVSGDRDAVIDDPRTKEAYLA